MHLIVRCRVMSSPKTRIATRSGRQLGIIFILSLFFFFLKEGTNLLLLLQKNENLSPPQMRLKLRTSFEFGLGALPTKLAHSLYLYFGKWRGFVFNKL